ncbi:MAG: immunity 26/phosphotriesterase HocA family protein [Roseburia sp.]|nr:immunity 26/phosphotriesterase HocA family protein [Roseburia sp.]
MELTNEQRKYLGLELIEPDWERVEIPNNCVKPELSTGKDILFFDGDVLRKVIWSYENGYFLENSYRLCTQDNRTMIAPRTEKGRPKRLNGVNIQRCTPYGMYFDYSGGIRIANYTTQQTWYSSSFAGVPFLNPNELGDFLDKWIDDTTDADFAAIQAFAHAKRKHCKYKEGDFFRFKYDRTNYGYGRILLDVKKFVKDGGRFWNILMGKALCVSVYHIITENPNVRIETLQELPSCPSEYIMDNRFFYGDYEIIGNAPVPENADYPIMYGRSISALDRNKICFCRGREYREIPLEGHELLSKNFTNNGITWTFSVNKPLVEDCIRAGSNEPFWKANRENDLRNPIFSKELAFVLEQMRD